MFGFLSAGSVGLKLAIIGIALTALVAAYWHYTVVKGERDTALQEVGALRAAKAVQDTTIKVQKEALDNWKAEAAQFQDTLNQMVKAQTEANETARKLNDVLSRHDLHALSLARPGLIERRINSGSADVLGLFYSVTSDSNNDSR